MIEFQFRLWEITQIVRDNRMSIACHSQFHEMSVAFIA